MALPRISVPRGPEEGKSVFDSAQEKLPRPDLGTVKLKKEFGLPHGLRQIQRVLGKYGLAHRYWRHDPEFELRSAERRLGLAKLHH